VTLIGCGIPLSGLLAEPDGPPRALVLALHGGGMTAEYFHGQAHPDLSLLTLGSRLGYSVLALDRPGYGSSAQALPKGQTLLEQTATVHDALDAFGRGHDVGAGIFVVAHSFGYKLALHLAADTRGDELLGIDGSGAVYRYAPHLDPNRSAPTIGPTGDARDLFWGSEDLYPPGTFERGVRPTAPVPDAESTESRGWTRILPGVAARVRVPLQFSVAEHEKWWQVDESALAEYRGLFTSVPHMTIRTQA
jgi:pimeloyl-ACP methyl ester carboxylesterase